MFVPRSVGKKKASIPTKVVSPAYPPREKNLLPLENGKGSEPTDDNTSTSDPVPNNELEHQERELATLMNLALSNHSIWANNDLRRTLETREGGWISLALLVQYSPWFIGCNSTENQLIRAYRAHGDGALEIRMNLKSRSFEFNDENLYTLRRKDWEIVSSLGLRHLPEIFWDECTLYVENIPPRYRNPLHTLVNFLQKLLSSSANPLTIQSVEFPPRHGSAESDFKCRGFAFIVCDGIDQAVQALQKWSWDGMGSRLSLLEQRPLDTPVGPNDELIELAVKCGFRVLSKSRWVALKDEYLHHRDNVLAFNAKNASRSASSASTKKSMDSRSLGIEPQTSRAVNATQNSAPKERNEFRGPRSSDDYPQGCLVFVRNLHPETNKTSIKNLLSQAFGSLASGKELDYVDFSKGMDSCHVRASSPVYATQLSNFFATTSLTQAHGLDDNGSSSSVKGQIPVTVEVVQGKREELYWEKVPENIRRAAIAKVADAERGHETGEMTQRRKRRKKE